MKVLVVDDEPLIRRSLRRVFEQKKHQVFEAEDGLSGLKIWQSESPDLVILDVLMPGLTGPQVLSKIDKVYRDKAKVMLISAYTGEYDAKKAQELGADIFIAKPFENIFEFLSVAERLLIL